MKRGVDVLCSLLALCLASPLFLVTALGVRLTLGRPVFFRQLRPGLQGRPFLLIKFRTMHDGCGSDGLPLADVDRINGFGRFLRATSLDELPEFWNVLRGDMSLVGPRPLLMEYLDLYSSEQARRHEVRPGITGWAQVNGRNATTWPERLAADVWYVENRTLLLDCRILVRTIAAVLARKGISHPGEATMPKFRGSAE